MAKELPLIKTNTDTFQSWITKTNNVIETIKAEVITANSSAGITGSTLSPKNAILIGAFTANSIVAANTISIGAFNANATHFIITSRVVANSATGSAGQVLTSNGTGVYWSTVTSGGGSGVTSVASGNGLTGGPITSSGSISVNARTGLVANTTGLFVNSAFIESLVQATPLVTSGNLDMNGNDIVDVDSLNTSFVDALGTIRSGSFLIGRSFNHSLSSVDASTIALSINGSTTYTIGNGGGSDFLLGSSGAIRFIVNGQDRLALQTDGKVLASGVELGFKTIPQIALNGASTFVAADSGKHYYKGPAVTSAIILTIPDNSAEPCPVGTTITIVNDAATGNITIFQGGNTILQLGGTFNQSNRTITPGGFATALKVASNKWIVSGPGVS